MNRRQFFAASGLATATGFVAQPIAAAAAPAVPEAAPFKGINFQSDGLALDPGQYSALLSGLVRAGAVRADYYSAGGAVEELERNFAQRLGKPAAILLPTGTLANHLAVRQLAGPDRRVLVQAESHLYNDSGDCAQALSGLNLIPLAPGRSTFELVDVRSWMERSAGGRVETRVGVISIESPVRRKDHEMFDPATLERVCGFARQNGIRLHLDGARMFCLPYHSRRSVADYAALFDTVYVSLWKHFNGAAGAILAGDASFINGMLQTRRMFGGSLPQAWPEIALVTQSADRFQDEYMRAWKIADELIALLAGDTRFNVRKIPNGTSRFLVSVSDAAPELFVERLARRGVVVSQPQPDTGMIPMQVNPTLLRTSAQALFQIILEALPAH